MEFKLIFLSALTIFPVLINAAPADISVWSNGKQNIFLFGDFHINTNNSDKQAEDLIKAAKLLNALVLSEDLNENIKESSDMYPEIRGWGVEPSSDCLDLKERCEDNSIFYINIEYRIIFYLFREGKISLFKAIEKIQEILIDIISSKELKIYFNDIEKNIWPTYVWKILEKYKNLKYDDFLRAISIKDLCKLVKLSNFKKTGYAAKLILKLCCNSESIKTLLLKLIFFLGNNVLELRAIKLILENPDRENIFICAGWYHTNIISNYLKNYLGYKRIKKCSLAKLRKCFFCCCEIKSINVKTLLQQFVDKHEQDVKENEEGVFYV